MIQTVMNILCDIKESPELMSKLTPQTDIIHGVGLDSLQMINFVLALEDAFDLEIDFETFDYEHMGTIESLVLFLMRENTPSDEVASNLSKISG
ncbi:acyl carrier protein [Paenibacillus pini]|uniref:Carrier domain-containing protein n=1 Tax=Paenibacillus pini JCM 16418 TaxID=1236976 RepID=W7Z4B1_9BACL|nr:phosphopantetheine-binding protein [Paenibacillus pini]GAF09194.1 hypothetical protein JCM16418_3314 [Paenibacillus pini JCM 16418]